MKITLPKLMGREAEAVLTRWHAAEGDIVQKYAVLYEVEMPKLTTSKAAPVTGRLHRCVEEGTRVRYGQLLAEIEEMEETEEAGMTS